MNDDGVFINDAKVTVADLQADNGVVHVINTVLYTGNILPEFLTKQRTVKILSIHPNPASDYVHLSGLNDLKEGRLRLINMSGAVIRDTYLKNTSEPDRYQFTAERRIFPDP